MQKKIAQWSVGGKKIIILHCSYEKISPTISTFLWLNYFWTWKNFYRPTALESREREKKESLIKIKFKNFHGHSTRICIVGFIWSRTIRRSYVVELLQKKTTAEKTFFLDSKLTFVFLLTWGKLKMLRIFLLLLDLDTILSISFIWF